MNRRIRARTKLLTILGWGLCLGSFGCDRAPSSPGGDAARQSAAATGDRPNIVFILVDTLRADRLGAYGGPKDLTPFMDQVATEGVVFERAIATAPWTLPSVASLFSGVYPTVHKANDYDIALKGKQPSSVSVAVLSAGISTLAERLRDDGYDTAGFVANIFLKPTFGMNQGFDHYDDSFTANATRGKTLNEAAVRWLQTRKSDKPFFLYLHYMDVHAPYTDDDRFVEPLIKRVAELGDKTEVALAEKNKHTGYFGKSAKPYMNNELHSALFPYREYWWARYDAGVRQIDQYLGELQTDLDTLGVWDEAYVIITADHGEALGEHGIWTHGLSAHQDQLHVPLILRWPGKLAAGRRLAQSVSMFDLHATMLEQVGLAASGDAQCASLVDLLSGESHESHVALGEAVKHNAGQLALVQGKWKLFVDRGNDVVQLFDLDADPHERDDVSAQNPDVVARLSALLDERLKENAARAAGAGASRSAATPEEMERLRGLGYVGESTEETDDGGG